MARYPELIVLKVTTEMGNEIRQCAQAEDRSICATARRLLAMALAAQSTKARYGT